MKKVAVILAEGFEEIEALCVVDILRRAGQGVLSIGLAAPVVRGAHQVLIQADKLFDEMDFSQFDMIVLPGGLPGAEHLARSAKVQKLLVEFKNAGKKLAAICAAPWALSCAGVLGQSYTCYPGFEKTIAWPGYRGDKNVIVDGDIITSRGPATAMEFGLELVKILAGQDKYEEIKNELLF